MAIWQLHAGGDFYAGFEVAEDIEVSGRFDLAGKGFNGGSIRCEGKLRGDAFSFCKEHSADVAIVNGGERLRGGPGQSDAIAEIKIERPDQAGVGRNGDGVLRKN